MKTKFPYFLIIISVLSGFLLSVVWERYSQTMWSGIGFSQFIVVPGIWGIFFFIRRIFKKKSCALEATLVYLLSCTTFVISLAIPKFIGTIEDEYMMKELLLMPFLTALGIGILLVTYFVLNFVHGENI